MFVQLLLWMARLLLLGRREQLLRILALQQQLEAYQRQQNGRRLQLTEEDRRFGVMLRRRWPGWREALVMVKPETVVAWHRRLGRCPSRDCCQRTASSGLARCWEVSTTGTSAQLRERAVQPPTCLLHPN